MALQTTSSGGDGVTRTTNLPPTSSFTMMAYFMFNSNFDLRPSLLEYGITSPTRLMYIEADGLLKLWDGVTAINGPAMSLGVPYHLAITYVAGAFLGYRDGVVVLTDAITDTTGAQLCIGCGAVSDGLEGTYSHGRIWDVALSQQEIQREMYSKIPVRRANLNTSSPFRNVTEAPINYAGANSLWTVNGTHTQAADPLIRWVLPQRRRSYFAPAVPASIRTLTLLGVGL